MLWLNAKRNLESLESLESAPEHLFCSMMSLFFQVPEQWKNMIEIFAMI